MIKLLEEVIYSIHMFLEYTNSPLLLEYSYRIPLYKME